MNEALRTMFRTLPLDPAEPIPLMNRRLYASLLALSALHPRDEIEVMLGVQAMAAYHAAAAAFHVGMNRHGPRNDSTRHVTTACSAARTFDTLLKALERRQAKPLAVPPGRPDPNIWPHAPDPSAVIEDLANRARGEPEPEIEPTIWTPEQLALAQSLLDRAKEEKDNEGLDLDNTGGILPGGGMILMDHPTPQQATYMGRRLALMYQKEYAEGLKKGITTMPKLRGIRPGDLIP